MRPPFPSAAQAYAESIHSETASRHHPNSRLTILPLPSLAALYPLEDTHPSSSSSSSSSPSISSASSSAHPGSDPSYRGLSPSPYSHHSHHHHHHHHHHHRHQHAYQSYDKQYQKSQPTPSPSPASPMLENTTPAPLRPIKNEYLGTNMESLLDAVEVHSNLLASSSSSSPSPSTSSLSSAPSSPSADDFAADTASEFASTAAAAAGLDSHTKRTRTSPLLRRMSISNLVDDLESHREGCDSAPLLEENYRPRVKPMPPRPCSPSLGNHVTHKRKWSRLSTYPSEEVNRSPKMRRALPIKIEGADAESPRAFNMSQVAEELDAAESSSDSNSLTIGTIGTSSTTSTSDSKVAGHRNTTIISCYHASVAQKSYGSEKRFLCPPPIVHIQGDLDHASSGLTSKTQVAMSVVCEAGENNTLGQRSTLEDDQTSTFRYLYVSGTAKAKSFQLKLKVYGRTCLPNGFVANDTQSAEGAISESELPEPVAQFESQPIAIISKPSKKTAKARNVSSCILAGSLVSLFNRINSQTVRTKYMSVQDGELCAKSLTWSSFIISIVSNGPSSPAPARTGSSKVHSIQPSPQNASPITYGSEIILTEAATGVQSDRLLVCKVENGRILEGAIGPICQMQKVALQSLDRTAADGQSLYLGAVGDDHQNARFMDHSVSSSTVLRYEASTMTENSKPGGDDFLCWTIVGISKFEYAVDLP